MDMSPLSLFLFWSLSLFLLSSFSLTLRLHDLALFAGVVSSNQLSERKSQFNYSSVSSSLALSSLHYDKTACNVKHMCVCGCVLVCGADQLLVLNIFLASSICILNCSKSSCLHCLQNGLKYALQICEFFRI